MTSIRENIQGMSEKNTVVCENMMILTEIDIKCKENITGCSEINSEDSEYIFTMSEKVSGSNENIKQGSENNFALNGKNTHRASYNRITAG
ncbi:hypothetical protein D1614_17530 [Maribellus luteus]|uniref:Uncharacterized protein n=1 Tax=Maribellus luteus TaxID=2305463 RepID=A0A399SVA7_9BACT|nr:hypothetical protein [Maribellus luteus]RIJ46729.1 hypothetical protein D1614_17530 [Maribellus luteus]